MSTTPVLQLAAYDGNLTVSAQWQGVDGVSDYTISVFSGTQVVAAGAAYGGFGTVRLQTPLDGSTLYQVAVATGTVPNTGAYGNRLLVVTASVGALTAVYDGTSVAAQWTLPAGQNVSGAALALTDTSATATVAQAPFPGTSGVLPLPAPLDPTHTYQLTASGTFGPSTGPACTPLPLVVAPAAVTALMYDAAAQTVSVLLATPVPGGCDPGATLLANGAVLTQATGTATLVSITGVALDPSVAYAVLPFWISGGATGPSGPGVDVLVAAPVVRSAVFTPAVGAVPPQVSVAWENLPGPPYPTGALVTVSASGEVDRRQSFTGPGTGSFTPSPALNPASSYTVAVAAMRGSSQGPAGAALPLVAGSTNVTSAAYDGRVLSAGWAQASVPNATGYRLVVQQGGQTVAAGPASASGGAVDAALDPGAAYTVAVQAEGPGGAGPPGTPLAVVSALPAVSAASVSATAVTVTVAPPASTAGIDHYQALLFQGGRQVAASAPVAAGDAPAALIGAPTAGQTGYSVRVRGLGTGGGGTATGPLGPSVPVPCAAPVLTSAVLTGTTLNAAWNLPAEPPGTIVSTTLTLTPGTGAATTFPNLAGTSAPLGVSGITFDPTLAYTLTAACNGPVGTGLSSAPLAVIPSVPSVTAAAYDRTGVSATWAWAQGASGAGTAAGYRMVLRAGGAVVASTVVTATGGTLALAAPLDPGGTYTLGVNPLTPGGETVGPSGTEVTLITAAPAVASLAFAPLGGGCTITWPVIAGAPAYAVQLTNGAAVVKSDVVTPTTGQGSYLFPAADFAAQGSYAVTVRAQDAAASPVATGPWCAPVPVLAATPGDVAVSYDGANVTVRWSPVASPLVTGYQVSSVAGGVAAVLGTTAGPGGTFPLTADPGAPPAVVVQALAGASPGPPSAAADVLVQGLFLSTGAGVTPSIAPRTAPTAPAADLVLYLPQLFATTPTLPNPPADAPFALALAAPGTYTLTIAGASDAWTFTSQGRAAVLAAYQAMLAMLEANTATPLGIRTVQEAVSRAMPQTFAETLYYAYGLTPAAGWIDLKPGMVLRAEYEAYQVPSPRAGDSAFISGFVATGTAEYEVASYTANGAWLTGLDAFLATVASAQGFTVTGMAVDPNGRAQGAGGLVDAFFPGFQQPYCRLVYPPRILGQDSPGSAYPTQNPMLLASPSLANLDIATASVRNALPPPAGVASFYFRGRATLTACIRVVVNGSTVTVPVGTTVGNVLASRGARPPVAGLPLKGVSLLRPYGAAVLSANAAARYPVGGGWNVRLDWSPGGTYGPNTDWLDLPLLHGDQLAFGAA